MRIIILGAGQVGSTLAEHLTKENNDITVIDQDTERLLQLQEHLDLRTIPGNACYPNLLARAGAEEADMLIAVTSCDEVNMIASQVAHTLFQIPTKIARIRSLQFLSYERLFSPQAIPVDVLISPEQLIADHLRCLIEHPDATQVLDFANKKIQLIAMKTQPSAPLVNQPLKLLRQHIPTIDARIVAIFRNNKAIPPTGDTMIEANDHIFFLAQKHSVRAVMSELRQLSPPNQRIIIAGGGNIGTRLTLILENDFNVKVIEHNHEQTELLASQVNKAIVLHGDCADKEILLNEGIESTDIFCAITNNDEVNILAATLAKHLGARKVMALVNRPAYAEIVESDKIDLVISPQQTTIGSLLTYVRKGDVVKVYSLRHGAAEAIEAIAHGSKETSKVIGKSINDIPLPEGSLIGAIIRKDEVIMGHHDCIIQEQDHVILFVSDKRKISDIENLFQVDSYLEAS